MAEAGGIPVILYNVPSRTGLNIAPETARELSRHPLINGIKEPPAISARWQRSRPSAATS